MVLTIEDKIEAVFENTEHISQNYSVEIGSDAYLDRVNQIRERFETLTDKLSIINEELITLFNTSNEATDSEAFRLLPKLRRLFQELIVTINKCREGKEAPALKTTLDNIHSEAKQLREVIDDIVNIKVTIKSDTDLQSLFSQL